MKRFYFLCFLFALPVLALIVGLEVYLKTAEGEYLLKSRHFKKGGYQILILGSSHCQNAINPAFLAMESCNAAMGSQDLKMDVSLLKKAIKTNPSLKIVIVEMSYHRFRENPPNYWRNSLYEYFYDVKLTDGVNFSKYFLLGSNLKFFRNYFGDRLSRRKHSYRYNRFGFDENDYDGVFKEINYNDGQAQRMAKRPKKVISANRQDAAIPVHSFKYLQEINSLCVENNLKLILIATPVYQTWSDTFDDDRIKTREELIGKLQEVNPDLKWINFEKSSTFKITDFKNEDHLNATGASLFTTMLNDTITTRLQKH